MRYRLSGRVKAFLHLVISGALGLIYSQIEDGNPAWALAAYASGVICMWLFSLPGAKRRLLNSSWGYWHFARKLRQNGFEHGGHARREEWDRYGRHSRVLLHVLCACLVFLLAAQTGFGAFTGQGLILGLAFSLGVETGLIGFKTGDAVQLQPDRHPRTSAAPGPAHPERRD